MILLAALLVGGLTGWGIARWRGNAWRSPAFRLPEVAVIGFVPQFIAFYFPFTRVLLSDSTASWCLMVSQALLLVFAWLNRSLPGMSLLMFGLGCNLAVIVANGGFMPLPVGAASQLVPQEVLDELVQGGRISHASKDVLLPEASIRLLWLADFFVSPSFLPYRFAYSIGDIFIALGAFWLLVKGQLASPP